MEQLIKTPSGWTSATDRTVHVLVPIQVDADLKALQKVTADILGQLGCPNCHSGYDIRFDTIREFVVDEKMQVKPIAAERIGAFIVSERGAPAQLHS